MIATRVSIVTPAYNAARVIADARTGDEDAIWQVEGLLDIADISASEVPDHPPPAPEGDRAAWVDVAVAALEAHEARRGEK